MSTRERMMVVVVVAALLWSAQSSPGQVSYVPWTTAETDLFTTETWGAAAGSAWSGNTLVLNYGWRSSSYDVDPPVNTHSVTPDMNSLLPPGAIGISFDVNSTLDFSDATLLVNGYRRDGEFVQSNHISTEFTETGVWGSHDLSDWAYVITEPASQVFMDQPTETNGGITTIQFLFTNTMRSQPRHLIHFDAVGTQPETFSDPAGSGHICLAGTTTFAKVCWIVPEPATLLSVTLGGLALLRRRR